jgi:hypothetical protein
VALLTVTGLAVTRGRVVLPREGGWHADLWLDADTAPSGAVALSWGDGAAAWQATVVPGRVGVATEGGPAAVRLAGGAGGLAVVLDGQSYRNTSVRIILGHLLAAAGERPSPTSPAATLDLLLPRWSRMRASAGAQLDALASSLGVLWRVLPDGSVYVGPEPGGTLTLDESGAVTARAPAVGRTIVAVAAPWTLTPGQSFEGARIDEIIHRISDREVRSELWRAP